MIVPFLGLRWKTRVTRVMTPLPLGNFYASKALTPALSRRKRGKLRTFARLAQGGKREGADRTGGDRVSGGSFCHVWAGGIV